MRAQDALRAVTDMPGQPGSAKVSWAVATVLGGVINRPLRLVQDCAVPEGMFTAETAVVADWPGASTIWPLLDPVRVAWRTWVLPERPATPGKPPVVQFAFEVFLKVKGTTTWPAAPEGSPALIVSCVVEHQVGPFVVLVVEAGLVVGVAVVGVVLEVELQAAPRRARPAREARMRRFMESKARRPGSRSGG